MVERKNLNVDMEHAIVNISRLLEKYDEEFSNHRTRITNLEDSENEITLQLDIQNRLIEKLRDDHEFLCHIVTSLQHRLEFELPQPNWEE